MRFFHAYRPRPLPSAPPRERKETCVGSKEGDGRGCAWRSRGPWKRPPLTRSCPVCEGARIHAVVGRERERGRQGDRERSAGFLASTHPLCVNCKSARAGGSMGMRAGWCLECRAEDLVQAWDLNRKKRREKRCFDGSSDAQAQVTLRLKRRSSSSKYLFFRN